MTPPKTSLREPGREQVSNSFHNQNQARPAICHQSAISFHPQRSKLGLFYQAFRKRSRGSSAR